MRGNRGGAKTSAAFTLIELMIAVAIVGVLATLALFGVRKYVATTKATEARVTVAQIGKLAVARTLDPQGAIVDAGNTDPLSLGSGANVHGRCPTASPVPASMTQVANRKYQSRAQDWMNGGWHCLRFSMESPQYFQYGYDDQGGDFAAYAHGDLNGDGITSTFRLRGRASSNAARLAPNLEEIDAEE